MKAALFLSALLFSALPADAAKIIPNGSNSQSITVVIRDAAGAPVTGIDVTNLDLYVVKDGDQLSAKTDLTALANDHAAWSSGKAFEIGLGLYRIDIPDANLSDGVGTMLTYVVDDAVGANITSFYEVQLKDPWQTGDSYAIVNNGTYGNSALKTLIDAIVSATARIVGRYQGQ